MRRRDFIAVLGAAAWALPARGQQKALVIGLLNSASPQASASFVAAFHRGLNEGGYFEGQNVAVEYRWAEGHYDLLPALAADLVAREVDLIVATGGSKAGRAAMAKTSTIPIVFLAGDDPVKAGLVASHARPGGNLTGVSLITAELEPKRIELLREFVPTSKTIGALVNPTSDLAEGQVRKLEEVARAVGQRVVILTASTEQELDDAFAALVREKVDGLLVASDPFFNSRRDQLVALARAYRLPTTYEWREFVLAGGLASYGVSLPAAYWQVGVYAGRILAGAKPADLPVQQPTKVELVVNLQTALTLGLIVPPSLLARADEVIE